jgi:hypothetical protein
MTLTSNMKLESAALSGDFAEDASAAVIAEAGEGQVITVVDNTDWTYSGTAESIGGEVTGVGGLDFDAEPGIVYSGPVGGAVQVNFTNLDVAAGLIAPEATDTATVAIVLNNDIVAFADEGYVNELDALTVEYNASTYIGNLQTSDVIRVAIVGNTEETLDLDVAEGGEFDII